LLLKKFASLTYLCALPINFNEVKVLRIIARLNVGGPAKHVVWLTAALQGSDYDTLLVAGSIPPGEEDMGYFAKQAGVHPFYLKEMSREISPKDALIVWKLLRLFLRERPDIVHTHTAKAGTVGRLAGFLYRWSTPGAIIGRPRQCKLVHTYHGHVFHSYYGPLKTKMFLLIERLLARLATDCLVVISEQQRSEIFGTFQVGRLEQFKVIPLGLDLEVFAKRETRRRLFRDELSIGDDVILVGIIGRLTEIKNHELFLRGVACFKNLSAHVKHDQVKFVVIGDGALRGSLQQLTRTLGLEGSVVFAGSRKDPENFYPALDVVALTSRNEGTPLTLIEAMANARPIIATAVGGVRDLLGESIEGVLPYQECRRGISIESDNEESFAAGLLRLVEDSDLRNELGLRGKEFVERTYPKQRLVEDVKKLYVELMTAKAPGLESQAQGFQSGA
jgi:glycosyltransferase involved in cell wall biosynthesis